MEDKIEVHISNTIQKPLKLPNNGQAIKVVYVTITFAK